MPPTFLAKVSSRKKDGLIFGVYKMLFGGCCAGSNDSHLVKSFRLSDQHKFTANHSSDSDDFARADSEDLNNLSPLAAEKQTV